MTKDKIEKFGIGNIITIAIVIASVVFNYAILTAKVEGLGDRLNTEVIERKLEDERIRSDSQRTSEMLNVSLSRIQLDISDIKRDLIFHLGEHKGEKETGR